jgi:hypothetical protein
LIRKAIRAKVHGESEEAPDFFLFFGFLVLSAISGLLSIWMPVGTPALFVVIVISIISFFLNFKELKVLWKAAYRRFLILNKIELFLFLFLIIFILATVSSKITLGDTESYHAQSIQWIRKYAVVPGLGNIHGRLAFNPMFFVISGLFTFQIKDILIFPLNGICYLILITKLIFLYKQHSEFKITWKSFLYIILLLISLLFLLPDLNSPAPDVMCAILIMYVFTMVIELLLNATKVKNINIILLSFLVFSCISFKISSLFLVLILLLFLKSEFYKRMLIMSLTGIIIMSPFIIRNFYLSGYLIYPFPEIDLFQVDWKIPYTEVLSMKNEIASWAKISTLSTSEVINMKFSDWIVPWFKSMNFNNKALVAVNFLSIISLIIKLLRKDFVMAKIQLIILISLTFWLLSAPDTRFAFGFLFVGFSVTLAYLISLFAFSESPWAARYIPLLLLLSFVLVIGRRIKNPADAVLSPSRWFVSAPFGTVQTQEYYSGFYYRVPVPEGGCYNTDVPCVPYQLKDITLRGDDLQEGFKVISQQD